MVPLDSCSNDWTIGSGTIRRCGLIGGSVFVCVCVYGVYVLPVVLEEETRNQC